MPEGWMIMDFNGLQVLGWVMMAVVLVCVVMSVLLLVKPGKFRWAYWVAIPTGLFGIGSLVYIALYMFAFNATMYGWVYLIIGIILLLNLIMASSTYWGWGKKHGKHSAHVGTHTNHEDDTASTKNTDEDDTVVNAVSGDNVRPNNDDDSRESHDDMYSSDRDTDVWNVVRSTSDAHADAAVNTDNAEAAMHSNAASDSDDAASEHLHDASNDDETRQGNDTPVTTGTRHVSRERNPFA